jgi:hypothetical protein
MATLPHLSHIPVYRPWEDDMNNRWMMGVLVVTLCGGTALAAKRGKESSADMRGISVLVGGGVEGYTSDLSSEINPGAAYGATLVVRPTKVVGLELGYSGAINDFDRDTVSAAETRGPDLVRNGAQAVATLGLTAAPIQPYVLAGVGISRYSVRTEVAGFDDATVGNVPLGGGVRLHLGSFTADARLNYSLLLDQQFAPTPGAAEGSTDPRASGGRYTGTLNFGATW